MSESLIRKLSSIPTFSQELGIDLRRPEGRFRWFLASLLFSKRISREIAIRTYKEFEREGITTPDEILKAGRDKLVEVLDRGGYVRYDFSTAENLLQVAKKLRADYGNLEELYRSSEDSRDLERKLAEFKGVGETCVNIFLRELRRIWEKADPDISPFAERVRKKLSMDEEATKTFESQLVRIYLDFCKGDNCGECPVREFCRISSPEGSAGRPTQG